jgi:fatty acid desaturase
MSEWNCQDIIKKIPSHYKRPHNLRSFSYLLFDLGMIALFIFVYQRISLPHLQWLVTLLFIYFMGVFFTALWVLAHECGHGAFCRPLWLQSTIGYFIHCF